MKRIICIWGRAVALVLFCVAGVRAEDFYGSNFGAVTYEIFENSVVHENALVSYDAILMKSSVYFENKGTITSDIIIVDAGKELFIKNTGKIFGEFYISPHANLVQIINNTNDLNRLNIIKGDYSSFSILAENLRDVNFMDLVAVAKDADKIILKDSVLSFNYGDNSHVPIEIAGEVVLVINNAMNLDGKEILSGIFDDGAIFIISDIPNLFYAETEINAGSVILRLNRETDYTKIMDGSKGLFLNQVRTANANNKLLVRLDAAKSGAELDELMNNSAMFNPVKLMDMTKLLSRFSHAGNFSNTGVGGGMMTIFGNGISLYSAGANVEFVWDDISFGFNLNAGIFQASRNWSDNSGMLYGGGVYLGWSNESFFISMTAGINYADFNMYDPLFDGTGAKYDANGFAFYGSIESGFRIFDGAVYMEPISRLNVWHATVLDSKDTELSFGAGARIGRRTENMGVMVDYSGYGIWEQEYVQFGLRADILLGEDDTSVGIDIGALRMESDWFYKIGIQIRQVF